MRLRSKRGPMHEINVVPYVDVMLVLLVIFMVTAPLITPGVVDLPSVGKSAQAPVAPLEVIVKEDASIIVRSRDAKGAVHAERRVAKGELSELIKAEQANSPERAVLIAGDKAVRYEAVLGVMDELHKQRVRRVGLLVKPAN